MSAIIALALVAAASGGSQSPEEWVSPREQEILPEFRGRWAVDGADCSWDEGPAFVSIGARHVYFFERYAYLELAQVNWLDSPAFYGDFHIAGDLRFSHETIRLEKVGEKLSITEGATPNTPRNKRLWHRCGQAAAS